MRTLIHKLLYKYVDWERMWYIQVCKFKQGDKVTLNWKAKVYGYKIKKPLTFLGVDSGGIVKTVENETWNIYWLCRDSQNKRK